MKVIVVGAGLGGLGTALRLQGAGHDVTVVEQLPAPGGRASQIVDGRYVWDTGPSLITMPWTLEETFAAGGLNFHDEVDLMSLEPYYRIHWAREERHMDFMTDREAMKAELAKFSSKDAQAFDGFMAALKPIYEEGILAAGRRSFDRPISLASLLPTMLKLGAALPLHTFVSRHFENERVREAMGFHSLFIGGDPFRVPAIYGALVYLQFLDGVQYARGGVYAVVQAMARHLDIRCNTQVARIEHSGGRTTGIVTTEGERLAADAVVWNGDAVLLDELSAYAASCARAAPRCRPTCSTSAPTASSRGCCTTRSWWAPATSGSSRTSPAAAGCPRTTPPTSTRPRARMTAWRPRAATRSRCCSRCRTSRAATAGGPSRCSRSATP